MVLYSVYLPLWLISLSLKTSKFSIVANGKLKSYGFPSGSVGKELASYSGDAVQSLDRKDLREVEMAPHPGILAWEIPHNWVTKHTCTHQILRNYWIKFNITDYLKNLATEIYCYNSFRKCFVWSQEQVSFLMIKHYKCVPDSVRFFPINAILFLLAIGSTKFYLVTQKKKRN